MLLGTSSQAGAGRCVKRKSFTTTATTDRRARERERHDPQTELRASCSAKNDATCRKREATHRFCTLAYACISVGLRARDWFSLPGEVFVGCLGARGAARYLVGRTPLLQVYCIVHKYD